MPIFSWELLSTNKWFSVKHNVTLPETSQIPHTLCSQLTVHNAWEGLLFLTIGINHNGYLSFSRKESTRHHFSLRGAVTVMSYSPVPMMCDLRKGEIFRNDSLSLKSIQCSCSGFFILDYKMVLFVAMLFRLFRQYMLNMEGHMKLGVTL